MCGRFTLKTSAQDVAQAVELAEAPPAFEPRYNIAPSLDVLAVAGGPLRRAAWFRWGLVPRWAQDTSIGNRLANARVESLSDKPSFRDAARLRRCLVLADGFYEWRQDGRTKTPFHFSLADGKPFAIGGLWDAWAPRGADAAAGTVLHTCCLITTEANAVVAPVHDRMPILVAPEHMARWLEPRPLDAAEWSVMLASSSSRLLQARPVSSYVNSAGHEGPRCLGDAEPSGLLPF